MPGFQIEEPDPEELGGNVTKPFKFVTGTTVLSSRQWCNLLTSRSWYARLDLQLSGSNILES